MSWYQRIRDILTGARAGDPKHLLRGFSSAEPYVKVPVRDLEEMVRSHDSMDAIVRAEHWHGQEADQVITIWGKGPRERAELINVIMLQMVTTGYKVVNVESANKSERAYISVMLPGTEEPEKETQPVSSGPHRGGRGPVGNPMSTQIQASVADAWHNRAYFR